MLKSAFEAVDNSDYAKAIELVSSVKFVPDDIVDIINEMGKKTKK